MVEPVREWANEWEKHTFQTDPMDTQYTHATQTHAHTLAAAPIARFICKTRRRRRRSGCSEWKRAREKKPNTIYLNI